MYYNLKKGLDNMFISALDVGYGWTKAKYGDKIFRQPSVLGNKRELHEENKKDGYIIHEDYFVGELAVKHSDIKYYSLKDSKASTWTTEELIKIALGYLGSDGFRIVSGLPVDFYFQQRKEFEELLNSIRGREVSVEVLGKGTLSQVINTQYYKIVPQPLGAAMDYLLNDKCEFIDRDEARKRILVIDWGRYTLDFLILDGMEIHRASCSPPNLGIEAAYSLLRRYIREKFEKTPASYEMDRIVKKGEYEGYDVTPLIDVAFQAVAQQIMLEIEGMNLNFHCHLVVGGQAEKLSAHLDLLNKVVGSQLSNIYGFEKIGKHTWGVI